MENASKALIIAGAILLSILIISLGIMVYNNAKSTVGDANLDAETIQTFNSKFTMYCGTGVSAAKANSLVEAVNSNNVTNDSKIEIVFAPTTGVTGTALAANTHYTGTVDATNKKYNIILSSNYEYNIGYEQSGSGIINKIVIVQK